MQQVNLFKEEFCKFKVFFSTLQLSGRYRLSTFVVECPSIKDARSTFLRSMPKEHLEAIRIISIKPL